MKHIPVFVISPKLQIIEASPDRPRDLRFLRVVQHAIADSACELVRRESQQNPSVLAEFLALYISRIVAVDGVEFVQCATLFVVRFPLVLGDPGVVGRDEGPSGDGFLSEFTGRRGWRQVEPSASGVSGFFEFGLAGTSVRHEAEAGDSDVWRQRG
jgi:hypothetical protein